MTVIFKKRMQKILYYLQMHVTAQWKMRIITTAHDPTKSAMLTRVSGGCLVLHVASSYIPKRSFAPLGSRGILWPDSILSAPPATLYTWAVTSMPTLQRNTFCSNMETIVEPDQSVQLADCESEITLRHIQAVKKPW